ncbi:CPBP family intramembrane glutamic endopeptidase [Synechococcus sp. KORDI-100]|uniref:CPBP family intramembrane glutamic endopeptidase n=1 Tax=Synechococcus sp. KORDI-100 TaxID=1280380 RepID=UPI00056DA572|nr:CPBP family intramembrane glutamic endopeptidase [Synechococcus sp. KORDI-100]
MQPSSSRPTNPAWKIPLAVVALLLATVIWLVGLIDSLTRPSVAPSLQVQQQELSLLAQPSVPETLQGVLVGGDPRDVLLQALQGSTERLNQRQQVLLSLLSTQPAESPELEPMFQNDPLLVRLRCEAAGGDVMVCNDPRVSRAAALRLGLSIAFPLLSVIGGCVLLLRQGWLFVLKRQSPWPPLRGPALTLVDMVLLVAGGFVVISAVGVPVVAVPLVQSLTSSLASPRREALGVVIQYGVMALPGVLILRRQLRALPTDQRPADGWLQWQWQPVRSAMGSAVAGWLMVTPVVMLTGWLLVKLVGDPGGSNPLLELVLGSRDPLALALLAFTAVVLAPLFEELIFRGALLPVLATRLGALPAVVLSALLFGLAHISIGELAPLTVLGMGLALVRLSSGRLFPCVLMHALWNAITFVNLLLL